MQPTDVVFLILCFAYGILSIFAALSQLKKNAKMRRNAVIMSAGGVLLIVSAILLIGSAEYVIYFAAAGLLLIHIAAVLNGLSLYRKLKPIHHIIRLCVSAAIITMYLL